jgi:hypothetical protein
MVPLYSGVTLAVKVTAYPTCDGFCDETNVVVVLALLTTCFTAFEVLPTKFESPPYAAVTDVVPAGSAELGRDGCGKGHRLPIRGWIR